MKSKSVKYRGVTYRQATKEFSPKETQEIQNLLSEIVLADSKTELACMRSQTLIRLGDIKDSAISSSLNTIREVYEELSDVRAKLSDCHHEIEKLLGRK